MAFDAFIDFSFLNIRPSTDLLLLNWGYVLNAMSQRLKIHTFIETTKKKGFSSKSKANRKGRS